MAESKFHPRRAATAWLVLPLLLVIAACEQDTISPEPRLTVQVWKVGRMVASGKQHFLGRVVPADLTRVAFRIPGNIAQLAVQAGQDVVAGQVIARLDDSIQLQVLADATAQYQLSRRQLERAENLFEMGALTPAQRDELQAGYRLATARLELAKAELSYTVVEAPFDGTIAVVDKELFEAVAPGETVATLFRNDRTDVLVELPDALVSQIHLAPNPDAFSPRATFSGSAEVYPLRYLKSSMARDPKAQAFTVWLTIENPDLRFPPGLPATVVVDLEQAGLQVDSGLVVPVTALEAAGREGQFEVWRYRDGTVAPMEVAIGRISQQGVLVTGGLEAGDLVVTSSLSRLSPGQEVDVQLLNAGH
jgi:RND family efflux transporter MFP subunit